MERGRERKIFHSFLESLSFDLELYPLDSLQIPQWHAAQSPWAWRRSVPYCNCCYVVWISWKKSQLSGWKPSYISQLLTRSYDFSFAFFFYFSSNKKLYYICSHSLVALIDRHVKYITFFFALFFEKYSINYKFFFLINLICHIHN